MLTRRQALKRGIGGVSVLVAGGLVWRAWENGVFSAGQGPAYEPWHGWASDDVAPPLSLVRAAILAANAHNTQPWGFHVSADRINLVADLPRNLGSFDPFRREMFISLGCALENLMIAARHAGIEATVDPMPGALPPSEDTTLAATVGLAPGKAGPRDPLFDAIPRRHTNRGAYDPSRRLPTAAIETIGALGNEAVRVTFFDGNARDRLGALVVAATEQIVTDRDMAADSARWFHFDWDAVQQYRDGITLDAAGLPPLLNAAAKIIPAPSPELSDRQWLSVTRDVHVATAPRLGMILVRNLYDRPTCLQAGRVWQRLHLTATGMGLAMQPLNQPVEMVDRERQRGLAPSTASRLAEFTDNGWKPTFVFRIGYAERPARPSPRRALKEVVQEV